ncbi:GNAT family N-acetyltransferase [Alkalimonas amylolytica]|uniref:Acetyltransferase (GNAT) domain-containing protein n=1 Tax=Alkalimonas amylolytica TaxID=152573 RepID=A0A1H4EKP6_ALKAM|nr:GNAT family N-acetyltransferase [Alkalimonas amylolytica]SEA85621.1 Acetyltransferase (GNAT) domain-containing protein [Alkalimonas amylolytica]
MVLLQPCSTPIPPELWQLKVAPDQQDFVLPISCIIAEQQPNEHFQLVHHQQQLAGFFLLDTGYSQQHAFAEPSDLGLRSFFIDQQAQGRGIASAVLRQLPAYCRQQFPGFKRLVLTVNCRNQSAARLYQKHGFADSGQLYLGGSAGPQHILWQSLRNEHALRH